MTSRVRPQENQSSSAVKTAATYSVDALNRAYGISYDDGVTPAVPYNYDESSHTLNGTSRSTTNGNGRRTSANVGLMDQIFSYDAVGRVVDNHQFLSASGTSDGWDAPMAYAWAKAGDLATQPGASATYRYNADGARVQKITAAANTWYALDLSGRTVGTYDGAAGAWLGSELYFGGRHLGSYNAGTGAVSYATTVDALGTERDRTSSSGGNLNTCTGLPFGDAQSCSGTDASPLHFTGQARDGESGLDYFGARYYSSAAGRFTSADWSDDPNDAVPYADLYDPQSLNLFGFSRNNPVTNVDTNGHEYLVCDLNGVNCSNVSDQDFETFANQYLDTSVDSDGNIFFTNSDGSEEFLGTAVYFDENQVAGAQQIVDMAAGPINLMATGLDTIAGIVFPASNLVANLVAGFSPGAATNLAAVQSGRRFGLPVRVLIIDQISLPTPN